MKSFDELQAETVTISCERCDGEGTPGHGLDCPHCRGAGEVTVTRFDALPLRRQCDVALHFGQRLKALLADAYGPAVPNSCPVCNGQGGWWDDGEPSTCDDCGGSGKAVRR